MAGKKGPSKNDALIEATPQTMTLDSIRIPEEITTEEVRKLLDVETKVLRESAERAGDQKTLAILCFVEAAEATDLLPLAVTLGAGAAHAASEGLSERDWMLDLLGRHSSEGGTLRALWRAMVRLRLEDSWPWRSPRAF